VSATGSVGLLGFAWGQAGGVRLRGPWSSRLRWARFASRLALCDVLWRGLGVSPFCELKGGVSPRRSAAPASTSPNTSAEAARQRGAHVEANRNASGNGSGVFAERHRRAGVSDQRHSSAAAPRRLADSPGVERYDERQLVLVAGEGCQDGETEGGAPSVLPTAGIVDVASILILSDEANSHHRKSRAGEESSPLARSVHGLARSVIELRKREISGGRGQEYGWSVTGTPVAGGVRSDTLARYSRSALYDGFEASGTSRTDRRGRGCHPAHPYELRRWEDGDVRRAPPASVADRPAPSSEAIHAPILECMMSATRQIDLVSSHQTARAPCEACRSNFPLRTPRRRVSAGERARGVL